jgi:hypothetical protein
MKALSQGNAANAREHLATAMTEVTRILTAIQAGDGQAAEQLLPLVYEELRRLAAQKMAQEAPGQTLQATALVHEAYLRLVKAEKTQNWDRLTQVHTQFVGFCWHQGWNDGCNEDHSKEYAKNMPLFISDVRKDLGIADLPFVIANSGFGGHAPKTAGVVGRLQGYLQPAQAAAAQSMDNVQCVDTRDFYRPEAESPGVGDIEHWFSNPESYFLIGDAMGKAMKSMLSETEK